MPFSCRVCLGASQSSLNLITTTCGHIAHTECLEKHMKRSVKCPRCDKKLVPGKHLPVYPNISGREPENNTLLIQEDEPLKKETKVLLKYQQCPLNCDNQDDLDIHRTVVDDYNQLVKDFIALEDEMKKQSICIAKLEHETEVVLPAKLKQQHIIIQSLMKRPSSKQGPGKDNSSSVDEEGKRRKVYN